jgi:hypothetical protein
MINVIHKQFKMTDPSQLGQETQTIIDIKDAPMRLETYLAPDKFEGHDQEILVGMSNNPSEYRRNNMSMRTILENIKSEAGMSSNDDLENLKNFSMGIAQSTLGRAISIVEANSLAEHLSTIGCPEGTKIQDNLFYLSFMSRRNNLSMRFLNRAHLSDKARRLTSKDLKVTIATMLMLQRYPLEYKCAQCDIQNVRYIQHL